MLAIVVRFAINFGHGIGADGRVLDRLRDGISAAGAEGDLHWNREVEQHVL